MLQMTETRTRWLDTRRLGPEAEADVHALTGGGLPWLDDLPDALAQGRVLGDYGGLPDLQAVAGLLPLFGQEPLANCLRAAGCGVDGQGAVLTPPVLTDGYTEVRHFTRMAVRWAAQRYASYHVWAALPLLADAPAYSEELCAQYLAAGLTLWAIRPMEEGRMMIFADRALPRWERPYRQLHLQDPELPVLLGRGYVAADFGWDDRGMLLMLRPMKPTK